MNKSDLKVGINLYRFSAIHILSYEIIEIQTLKSVNHVRTFYIVKGLDCNDHEACLVALKLDSGNLVYSHMLNNYDEDDNESTCNECERNSQYYWHETNNKERTFFKLTRNEARQDVHKLNIKNAEKQIDKHKLGVKHYQDLLKTAKDELLTLQENE